MTSSNQVTLEHINTFFSLDKELKPLDLVPTVTGGMGIILQNEHTSAPYSARKIKGTAYAKRYIEEEARASTSHEENLLESSPGPSGSGLNSLEELSTTIGDIQNVNSLKSEDVHQLQSAYYHQQVQYNPNLSITRYREQILQLIGINQIVVIQGPTGCGKTTQVPQYILDHHVSMGQHCNIIVTQPRKIAAISIARRICEERRWQLGSIVGYQVGMDNKTSSDTRISYVTTGVLLQKLVNSRKTEPYTHIILDEVHERDQDTDFALLVIKKLIRSNSKNVKLIMMSATIDASIFAEYFASPGRNDPAPIVEIHGKSKEVTEHYLQELLSLGVEIPVQDPARPFISDELYELVVKLMFIFDKLEKAEQNTPRENDYAPVRGSVLIFLPGYEEISTMTKKLRAAAVSRKYVILPLHSSITVEEQSKVFRPPAVAFRKVILSTNIAESSITVPDIKYVIDFCLTKNLVCDQDTNYVSLMLEWASKANCIQRKGRAGRVDIGRVYRMITRQFYEEHLPDYNVPELRRCPLNQTVLFAKKLDFGEPQALLALAIDPPALCDIENAVLSLKEVGALATTVNGVFSSYDGDLTFIGRVMLALPLDIKVSKLILFGYAFDCLEDCIIIAASLSLKSFFSKQFGKLLDSYKSVLSWANGTFSDCLAYLHAYSIWKDLSVQGQFNRPGGMREEGWAFQNFIQLKRIREVDLLVSEIKKRLQTVNIAVKQHQRTKDPTTDLLILKIVIAGAFYPNYFCQTSLDEKDILRELNNGDPLTTVAIRGLPPNHGVLYYNTLRELFTPCSSRMNIEFDERKAYIQFDKKVLEDDPTCSEVASIHPAVYFAIKMRELRIPLVLQVFSKDDAERKMEQLRRLQQLQNEAEPTRKLFSHRMTVQSTSQCVKHVDLPPINLIVVHVFITHVINCGHFWARYCDQSNNHWMHFLETTINMHKGRNLKCLSTEPTVGMLVLAPFADASSVEVSYYRATIEELHKEYAVVFFIDYGNTKKSGIQELREINPEITELMDIPALAFECQLSEVKPAALTSSGYSWSPESKNWFQSKVSGQILTAKVYSVVQNVVRLEAYLTKPNGSHSVISLNDELKAAGFAETAEESFLSKRDFEDRKRAEEVSLQLPANFRTKPTHFTPSDLIEPRGIRKTPNKIRLHGPSSPLEVSYFGMTYIDQTKVLKVDRDSVNSISLNPEPQDKHSLMLVSSSVTLGAQSNFLTARSTTLMPKVNGLFSLLCLMFSPTAELRTDKGRTSHTGALCGLGCNPKTGEPIYPEHQIEVEFDIHIDYRDLKKINQIRTIINVMLGHEDGLSDLTNRLIEKSQERLRENILKLMTRNRPSREPYSFSKRFQWMQVPSQHILNPDLEKHGLNYHVFTLHNCIDLSGENSYHDELKKQVKELYEIAGRSEKPEDFECWLCGALLSSRKAVLMHLDTAEHRQNEADNLI